MKGEGLTCRSGSGEPGREGGKADKAVRYDPDGGAGEYTGQEAATCGQGSEKNGHGQSKWCNGNEQVETIELKILPPTGEDVTGELTYLRGGAYWMPPRLQSWLMPRGMPSFEPTPTLRS